MAHNNNCTANDLILGGKSGLICVKCNSECGLRLGSADSDYAHCASCDKVINLDLESFVVYQDNTYCAQCAVKEK